jgi:hypothetical protein
MRKLVVVLMLVLTACGGGKKPDAVATNGPGRHKGIACAGFPDFVALPPDAVVETCHNGDPASFHVAGKIVFETNMTPNATIGFYRDKANQSGIPDGISNPSSDTAMYSANDTTAKRSIQVMADRQAAGGTNVSLEWSKENWDAAPKAN